MALFEKFDKYAGYYELCEEGRAALRDAAREICADGKLSAKACELKGKLADLDYEFKGDDEFAGQSAQFGAFVYTLALEDMEKWYEAKAIPRDIFIATASDLSVWINRHKRWFGEWGFTQYGWLVLHVRGKIFKLGRLQFEPPKPMWETPDEQFGLGLKEGDPFLSVHIPRGGRMDEQACLDSFEQAKSFFPKYLGCEFKAFGCFTWLFDPDFEKLLPPDSNILKFQRMFKIIKHGDEDYSGLDYIFDNIKKEHIKDAPTDTSFRKAIVRHILAGGIMRGGSGYRLI